MDYIYCANCGNKKIRNNYENFDENNNWFCSIECETKYKLVKYYNN